MSGKTKLWAVQVSVSIALIGAMVWLLTDQAIIDGFRAIDATTFMAVLLGFLGIHAGAALKWRLLLGNLLPLMPAIRAHFGGLAANLGLPGALGGDAVRAGIAHLHLRDGAKVVAAGTVDRAVDLLSLITLSALGLVLAGSGDSTESVTRLAIAGAFLVLGFAALISASRTLPLIWRVFPMAPGRKFGENLVSALSEIGSDRYRLSIVMGFSILLQAGLVALSWFLLSGHQNSLAFAPWLFAWPLAKIIAVIPISLNGLGVREAALATLLVPFGALPGSVVAAGLLWQLVMFAAGAVGALQLLLNGRTILGMIRDKN